MSAEHPELISTPIDQHTVGVYLEVPGAEVVLLQSLIESYEGIGTVRTIDIRRSLVCILTTPSMLEQLSAVLDGLRDTIHWRPWGGDPAAEKDLYLGYGKKGLPQ